LTSGVGELINAAAKFNNTGQFEIEQSSAKSRTSSRVEQRFINV